MIAVDDLRLPADVRGAGPARPAGTDPALVTGATGFLGASVVAELLASTDREVWCLVRPKGSQRPEDRLREALRLYGRCRREWRHRLRTLPGDLELPRFGLSQADYDRVVEQVAQIYHSGAVVSATYSYEAARPANVDATVEVLRLACQGRPKRVNHISTTSVLWSRPNARQRVDEMRLLGEPEGLPGGYVETKWAAEYLAREARERGVDVRVYRTGPLGGDTQTGISNPADVRWLLIQTCAALGLAPVFRGGAYWQLSWVPVDWVSTALVRLSEMSPEATRGLGVFHLRERNEVPWPEAFSWMRRYGFRIAVTSVDQWRQRVFEAAREAEVADSMAYFSIHAGVVSRDFPAAIESSRTDEILTEVGITCPELNSGLFCKYLDAGIRMGTLPNIRSSAVG